MTKKRKILTRVLAGLFCLISAMAAVLLMAPRIISSNAVKNRMLAKINATPDVNLQIDKLTLRWFKESRIDGIVFADGSGSKAEIESVILTQGIKSLASRRIDFGEIIINRPVLTLPVQKIPPQASATAQQHTAEAETAAGKKLPADPQSVPNSEPDSHAGIKLPVDLKGSVKVRNASVRINHADEPETVLDNIEIDMVLKWLENPLTVQLSATQGSGSINAALSLGGFNDRTIEPDKIKSNLQLTLSNLELGPLTRMAGSFQQALPVINGRLNANIRASTDGITQAALKASIKGDNIFVKTSGRFQPKALDSIEMRTDISIDGKNIEISTAAIESSAGSFNASGSLLDRGTAMPSGKITAKADINIAMLARIIPELLRVREDMEFTGGTFTAMAAIDSDGSSMTVIGNADLHGLSAISAGRPVTPTKPLTAIFNANISPDNVLLNELKVDSSFAAITASGDLTSMTAAFSADIAAGLDEVRKFVSLETSGATGQLDGKISVNKLQNQEAWHIDLQVNGNKMAAAGAPGKILDLGNINAEASLKFHSELAKSQKGITDFSADLKTAPLSINIMLPAFALPDTAMPYPEIAACRISADMNLERLAALLTGAGYMPENTSMSGTIAVNANTSLNSGTANVELQASGKAIDFRSGNIRTIEPAVTLSLKANHSIPQDKMTIEKLSLNSATLSTSLSGSIASVKTDKDTDIEGVFTCDYTRLADILSAASAKDIRMTGKREEKIHIKGKLGLSDKTALLSGITGAAGVYIEKLLFFGMDMTGAEFKINLEEGIASALIKTQVNKGKVELNPRISIAGSTPILNLPDNSRVLQGVTLTDGMVNEILALMHPLLKNCAAAGGHVDMTISRCSLPMDDSALKEMSLSGRLDLFDVVLKPEGLIKQILELAKLEQRTVTLENESINFAVQDGRVETSPLKLGGGSSAITISGSAGLDGKLNYTADTPVTEKMAGTELFPYLKGASIKIPIRGTASKPEINVTEFNHMLAAIVSDAGKKMIKEKGTDEVNKLIKEKGGKLLDGLLKKQ